MADRWKGRLPGLTVRLAGGFSAALGLLVMAGWHFGDTSIVQWGEDIVPMQYNTALAHVAIGLALLLSQYSAFLSRTAMTGFVLLALTLSVLTGIQYITGQSFGLDSLFMDPMTQNQPKTVFPGRMAPNTVICFILLSAALLFWRYGRDEESRLNTAAIMAVMVFSFSATAVAGYVFGIESAYGWWSMSNIAPQTATALLAESIGLAALAFSGRRDAGVAGGILKPSLAVLAGIVLTLLASQTILDQGRQRIDAAAQAEAVRVAHALEYGLGVRLKELSAIQSRWAAQKGFASEDRRNAVLQLYGDGASYVSIALLDNDLMVYESAGLQDGENLWDLAALDIGRIVTIERQGGAPIIADLPHLEGQAGVLLILFPLSGADDAPEGFLAAAYSVRKDVEDILIPGEDFKFHYEIHGESGILASNFSESDAYTWETSREIKAHIQGQPFLVRVYLSAANYEHSSLVFLIFISGLIASVLLGIAFYRTIKIHHIANRLKESEERYQLAVDGSGIALWDWDIENGKIAWAGNAWKIFGFTRNEDVPREEKDVRALIPAEDNEAINKTIFSALEKGDHFTVEFRLAQPDGSHLWAQSRGKVVERKNGKPVRSAGIFSDITKLKSAEFKILSYQAKLESILDNMVDGLITIDDSGIVQSYNKACEKIFGYKAEEVVGRNVKLLMPMKYADNHDQYIKNYQETGIAKVIGIGREVEGQRKDGTTFPLDLSVAEVWQEGKRSFSGLVRDITERKKYEDQLKRVNEELEQFAYIASHDLKAPLRGIDNLAKWIAEDLAGVLTDDAREKMSLLRGRVSRLEMLLEDILQYSRAGRIVDDPVRVDTKDMIEKIAESLDMTGSFKVNIAEDLPALVSSYTPLNQVFLNLISNARKHHDRESGSVKVAAVDRGAFYEFIVEDDGPGIPQEFHGRVFKMFQTLRPRDEKESSGLGLSIVKKLVEWQGGRVWIESREGERGTTFHFLWKKKFPGEERMKDAA